MKNTIIAIALALALILGVAAFAETADTTPESIPAVTEEQAEAPAEEIPEEAPAASAEVEKVEDLDSALEAFRAAREDKRLEELEDELNEYVEDGSMTQEQADLILNSVKEKLAQKNGQCPNCGYQFQGNAPRMGGKAFGNNQRGMQGGNRQFPGGMQNGGQFPGNPQNGNRQQPDAQSGATPRQPGSAQQMPGNTQPHM